MKNLFKPLFLLLFFSLFFFLFLSLAFWRFNQLQVFYYDFGIFARIIWLLSRFRKPLVNHYVLGKILFLADHFNPSLVILVPLFWVTNQVSALLVIQALATVLTGVFLYKIFKKI